MDCYLDGKNIILGVTGGIAAYKSIELLSLLKKQGADVRVCMTRNALEFVGKACFEALSSHPVYSEMFGDVSDASIRHIEWATLADLVIIAPATANFIGKFANGIADDALTSMMLAVTSPVMICPSMNTNMFQSLPVQRNIERLRSDGHMVLEPASGTLACGTSGPGRMPEPEIILDRIIKGLTPENLKGRRILITAGPTHEPIDPVRYISNPSSGKMGYALAKAAEHRGAKVILITGPTVLPDPPNVEVVRVKTAKDMAEAVFGRMDEADIIIKSAAVSDYRPVSVAEHKIKKDHDELALVLEKTQDILKELGSRKKNYILVGFAAETQNLGSYAMKKLSEKNLDMIVANLVTDSDSGFQAETNRVTLFFKDGSSESLPVMGKEAVAHKILDRVIERCQKPEEPPQSTEFICPMSSSVCPLCKQGKS